MPWDFFSLLSTKVLLQTSEIDIQSSFNGRLWRDTPRVAWYNSDKRLILLATIYQRVFLPLHFGCPTLHQVEGVEQHVMLAVDGKPRFFRSKADLCKLDICTQEGEAKRGNLSSFQSVKPGTTIVKKPQSTVHAGCCQEDQLKSFICNNSLMHSITG